MTNRQHILTWSAIILSSTAIIGTRQNLKDFQAKFETLEANQARLESVNRRIEQNYFKLCNQVNPPAPLKQAYNVILPTTNQAPQRAERTADAIKYAERLNAVQGAQ